MKPQVYGSRINPKTGMHETYELPPPLDLEQSRKELRDMIHGNYQWHSDPNAAPPEAPPIPVPDVVDDTEDKESPDYQDIYDYSWNTLP